MIRHGILHGIVCHPLSSSFPGPMYSPGDISKIAPITDLRKSNAGEVWEAVDREGKVLIVKNNRPKAVIVSWERWNEMQDRQNDSR